MKLLDSTEDTWLRRMAGGRAGLTGWLFLVVFYAVLANIPFWFAKRFLGFFHDGWFCLEYAWVGLVALFAPRVVAAFLLMLAIFADMICAVCETYFLTLWECLSNLKLLGNLDTHRLVVLSLLFVLTLLVVAIPIVAPGTKLSAGARWRAAVCLLMFVVICAGSDLLTMLHRDGAIRNPFAPLTDATKLSSFHEARLSRRTSIRLIWLTVHDAGLARVERSYRASTATVPSATAVAFRSGITAGDRAGIKPNIVLILLESWGLPNHAIVRDKLVEPYTRPELLAKYSVVQGTVPFYGPTMGGEGRELCGNQLGFGLMTASAQTLKSCLPERLAAQGYDNIALHGLDGHFFQRDQWWPAIGFEQEWFRDDFAAEGLPICPGAFPGICDASIGQWIAERLSKAEAKPQFLYWVTLNSHLPVPVPTSLPHGASCSIDSMLEQKAAMCSWYQLVANVHDVVSRLALEKQSRPTEFVVVGDHAPPFADGQSRAAFSSTRVPYVILTPKDTGLRLNATPLPVAALQRH